MSWYLWLKMVHILSGAVLLGTGLGIAYFKFAVDRTGDVRAIRATSEKVVVADWIFTAVAVVVQPVTGLAMAMQVGFPIVSGWIAHAIALYFLIGACWLPVVYLQIRMRDLARAADRAGSALPEAYWRYSRIWFCLGIPGFGLLLLIYWLMVFKPA